MKVASDRMESSCLDFPVLLKIMFIPMIKSVSPAIQNMLSFGIRISRNDAMINPTPAYSCLLLHIANLEVFNIKQKMIANTPNARLKFASNGPKLFENRFNENAIRNMFVAFNKMPKLAPLRFFKIFLIEFGAFNSIFFTTKVSLSSPKFAP
jgi:hypothetical protein